ncbi:hypothetical protein BS17DRAFT_783150 [Gyrodon lividus]|nr:hypothetical protein BS17DRAFT_783150 [Gyrodon lividus]
MVRLRVLRVMTVQCLALKLLSFDLKAATKQRDVELYNFGETEVGKSSVVNLIAGGIVAGVSPDVERCTLRSDVYNIKVDSSDLRIYDTVGLDEPQLGLTDYLSAIEKAHALIRSLRSGGGVDPLIFCIRGGRLSATLQHDCRLFS